ncbi:MAG: hypothetical protein RLZ10_2848 [Bacteroidota bacterium]|jgi:hypothetical protein
MKTINFLTTLLIYSALIISSCSSGGEKVEKSLEKEDSVATDETEMPMIDEVEMDYRYEVTNTKTKKTVTMSQEEYLESGVWENTDVTIKEIPVVK